MVEPTMAMEDMPGEEDHPLDRSAFLAFSRRAYDWTVGWDGQVLGLTAGDMHYEGCRVNIGTLAAHALSDTDAGIAVNDAINQLVTACAVALREAERDEC